MLEIKNIITIIIFFIGKILNFACKFKKINCSLANLYINLQGWRNCYKTKQTVLSLFHYGREESPGNIG